MNLLDVATERDLERFMDLVDVLPCGCWFWTGARSRGSGNRKWYGTFWTSAAGRVRAHRFACEVVGGMGELPRGWHRDHTCVFSLCVNPEHLEYVTHAENERRKRERRDAERAARSVAREQLQDIQTRQDREDGVPDQ